MHRFAPLLLVPFAAICLSAQQPARGQQPPAPEAGEAVTAAQLSEAIDKLGTVDYTVRMAAARTTRRAPSAIAAPVLLKAVNEHPDSYVRFRALVILSGFNDPRTRDVMRSALDHKNDRLRSVAYAYFEHNLDKTVLPKLLEAVDRESSEFVRPALTRALAAYGTEPQTRDVMTGLVMKGQAFFRSVVIEALGDYRGAYAIKPIVEVAKIDGPLQDDATLALGKLGDKSALSTLSALQRSAPRESQPAIAAAICLLGVNCESHEHYLVETLRFGIANIGFQELLRASATALAAVAASGRTTAASELIVQGAPTRDPARAAIALAVGTVALRNTPLMLKLLEGEGMLEPGADLLRDAFDMLEEDFEEERFFAAVRRAYWQAPAGSPARKVAETLIQQLDF
jgi:HEAT repeat protein